LVVEEVSLAFACFTARRKGKITAAGRFAEQNLKRQTVLGD